jgi:hypothetical protein
VNPSGVVNVPLPCSFPSLNSPRYSLPSGKVIDPFPFGFPFGFPFSISPKYFPSLFSSPFPNHFGSQFSTL